MVRMYEEHEIHECKTCGLLLQVTFAAVPIEPVTCCGDLMTLLKKSDNPKQDPELDFTPKPIAENAKDQVLSEGEKYTCSLCGIEVLILRTAQPVHMLDCCGEGMELMS